MNLRVHLSNLEDEYITAALQKSAGNITHAANLLGFERTTLVEKLKRKNSVKGKRDVFEDPEGEFTYRKREPHGYEVLYKGEVIAKKHNLRHVSAYIKRKVEE